MKSFKFILIMITASLFLYYTISKNTEDNQVIDKPLEYISRFIMNEYDDSGNKKITVKSEYWDFDPIKKISKFTKPDFLLVREDGSEIKIRAKFAKAWHETMNAKIDKIELLHNVVIEKLEEINSPITINCNDLSYFPEENRATTKNKVLFYRPNIRVQGIGMDSDFNQNIVKLHSKVSTKYEMVS